MSNNLLFYFIIFKNITNDEDAFITRLAKLATDLRIEDWDSAAIDRFFTNIDKYKKTASEFVSEDVPEHVQGTSSYQISYVDSNGVTVNIEQSSFTINGILSTVCFLYNEQIAFFNLNEP